MRLLLYAAVPNPEMLCQGFYAAEVDGLRQQPDIVYVDVTNRLGDVWNLEYDGLISYFYSYTAFAALIARIRGKRVIATGGGEQLFRSMAPSFRVYMIRLVLFWLSLFCANRILATSSTDYERMRKVGWFRRSAITLSFHGARAVDLFHRCNFSSDRNPSSMITICGMDTEENIRRKGLLRAIDLLGYVRECDPKASLVVIGRTTCAHVVRNYAATRLCADAVKFVGYVSEEEKLLLLKNSRYYIQLSEYEGFGIGALEAMAMGCQVIHSNVGGLKDTVAQYGIILPLDSAPEVDVSQPYNIDDWPEFESHMAQFTVNRRASAILDALKFL
ncbi:glycosyltransferase [Sphingorhabdus pulchriflava]|uniref:Glycosyltransferase n=1 Tax=Sphingorhabdus pulchriflava TaxID=2292257 RepID=A0A371B1N6_9SPHN|nr:glycosyltransferase [Sphingorhabdus pulchriflava]RDV01468.1 glycosyltransferase [Sphingorhabdus pulchriflava]